MHKLVIGLLAALACCTALAQGYPARPVTLVLPYPPGGTTDKVGRIAAKRLEAQLKVPVVVDNKAGASGTIGSDFVRRAPADGYTLLFNASIFLLGKSVLKAVPYDPIADFTPLARVGQTPLLLLAYPGVPANSIKELVVLAKDKPETLNFANSAAGSAGHLATIEFNHLAGLALQVVTYRGSAPALTDLVGGHVQLMIDPPGVALAQVKAGKLKALAVTDRQRAAWAPEIPTTAESGMPDLVLSSWYGVWAPKGLPADVLARLDEALAAVTHDPEFRSQLQAAGVNELSEGRKEFEAFIAVDVRRNQALLKSANFQPE